MSTIPTCMICGSHEERPASLSDEGSYVCRRCGQIQAHLLDDEDDSDGRGDARHLTVRLIESEDPARGAASA